MARKNAEYEGRLVRLFRRIETRGGEVFPAGSICKVRYVDRGKLAIEMPNPDPNNIFGPKVLMCRNVRDWDVVLLPKKG